MQKIIENRSRIDIELMENQILAQYAVRSNLADRLYMGNYKHCDRRTEFERDKDRIIYSLAFKRLMEKLKFMLLMKETIIQIVFLTHLKLHKLFVLLHLLWGLINI